MSYEVPRTIEELKRAFEIFQTSEPLAFDTETEGKEESMHKIVGFGIGNSNYQVYVDLSLLSVDQFKSPLEKLFVGRKIILHNAKFDFKVLVRAGIKLPVEYEDTMMMAWLVDENESVGLKNLTQRYLGRTPKAYSELEQESLFFTPEDRINMWAEYCSADVKNTYDLYHFLYEILIKEDLLKVYLRQEIPFIKILMDMEESGIKIDADILKTYKDKMEKTLSELSVRIKELVGNPDFNVNSPKQVEEYLFDRCRYNPGRITPTGKRSTDNEVLTQIVESNKLAEDSVPAMILKHRDIDKIYGTFVVALLEQRDENDRIHTNFLQHGTSSGRLSSNSPNLQNIPTRQDEWNVRQAFIPKEGHSFIIADYSQVELRILAHFSEDSNMINTFREGGDIHTKTMELTGTNRREAKQINFGIVYGMGALSLGKKLGITYDQAESYINRFFSGYPRVKEFLTATHNDAYKNGYVEMVSGRKRHLNFKSAEFSGNQGFFKRLAVNSKIQGSAADVIKMAMIKLQPALDQFKSQMLLQIHDELVIEVPEGIKDEAAKTVKEIMENSIELKTKLLADVKIGNYWLKD